LGFFHSLSHKFEFLFNMMQFILTHNFWGHSLFLVRLTEVEGERKSNTEILEVVMFSYGSILTVWWEWLGCLMGVTRLSGGCGENV
jgi:hypothetical protein